MSDVRPFLTEDICSIGEEITREGILLLKKGYNKLRERYLEHSISEITWKGSLFADNDGEKEFEMKLKTKRNGQFESIKFFGEESFRRGEVDLTKEPNTCVLVDALDGSDLYERDMGNWCSAAVFFTPGNGPGERIRAAIVGLPDESIYIADDRSNRVMVSPPDEIIYRPSDDDPSKMTIQRKSQPSREIRRASKVTRLVDASICFYGQKVDNLIGTLNNAGWRSPLLRTDEKYRLLPRVYNLAGIPMMMKLIDKASDVGSGIDLVMDLEGQQAHDVVPGAFMAKRAGAAVVDLEGIEITYERLEEVMLKPNIETLKYIVASTPELAAEAAATFKSYNT